MKLVDLVKMKDISCFSQKELSANDFPQLDDLSHFSFWMVTGAEIRKYCGSYFLSTRFVTEIRICSCLSVAVFHMKRVPFFNGLIPLVTQEAEIRL